MWSLPWAIDCIKAPGRRQSCYWKIIKMRGRERRKIHFLSPHEWFHLNGLIPSSNQDSSYVVVCSVCTRSKYGEYREHHQRREAKSLKKWKKLRMKWSDNTESLLYPSTIVRLIEKKSLREGFSKVVSPIGSHFVNDSLLIVASRTVYTCPGSCVLWPHSYSKSYAIS